MRLPRIHERSFWLGAHGSLMVLSLTLLPLSAIALFPLAVSFFGVWMNWTAMNAEDA